MNRRGIQVEAHQSRVICREEAPAQSFLIYSIPVNEFIALFLSVCTASFLGRPLRTESQLGHGIAPLEYKGRAGTASKNVRRCQESYE